MQAETSLKKDMTEVVNYAKFNIEPGYYFIEHAGADFNRAVSFSAEKEEDFLQNAQGFRDSYFNPCFHPWISCIVLLPGLI